MASPKTATQSRRVSRRLWEQLVFLKSRGLQLWQAKHRPLCCSNEDAVWNGNTALHTQWTASSLEADREVAVAADRLPARMAAGYQGHPGTQRTGAPRRAAASG